MINESLFHRKTAVVLLAVCILLLSSAASYAETRTDSLLEPGVSRRLAEQRSRLLADVEYDLVFAVPRQREESVRGCVQVSFNLNERGDVILDFAGKDTDATRLGVVNGRQRLLTSRDGHVIVSGKYLNKGHNVVSMFFTSSDKALNRHDDFMYTLFVPGNAHSAFPCFDQPDLKARFRLTLLTPNSWRVQTNTRETEAQSAATPHHESKNCEKFINWMLTRHNTLSLHRFHTTDPLPTYLFSFTTGVFERVEEQAGSYTIELLHRETDERKVSQVPMVINLIAQCVKWMEQYTGIEQPFRKIGYVVLPSYQFGGMEHPGSIHLTDRRIFLNPTAGMTEEMSRYNLIAHETAHLWFGDMVTMKWFDDVWTKEVFANFMADKMCAEQFPEVNHALGFLKTHYPPAMWTDRTDGTHPIRQPLYNLSRAGLLYGNIIYHKAPIMMAKLEQRMGEMPFRQGMRLYLQKYKYSNATWDDLISILDSVSPAAQLPAFSRVWVEQKGMPTIKVSASLPDQSPTSVARNSKNNLIEVQQYDVFNRNMSWPQNLKILYTHPSSSTHAPIDTCMVDIFLDNERTTLPVDASPIKLIPNTDGTCYARFLLDEPELDYLLEEGDDVERYASLLRLHDSFLQSLHKSDAPAIALRWAKRLAEALTIERNTLVAVQMCSTLCSLTGEIPADERPEMEHRLWQLSESHPLIDVRRQLRVYLSQHATATSLLNKVYNFWLSQSDTLLSRRQYTQVAYHLAIMNPTQWKQILTTQRERIKNADELSEFDYVARACNPDASERQKLFDIMLQVENRRVEDWTLQMLALLNSEQYRSDAVAYIAPGLNILEQLQTTGSIFYPSNWLSRLLGGHKSIEACRAVEDFLSSHANYPEALTNKLKEASHTLRTRWNAS